MCCDGDASLRVSVFKFFLFILRSNHSRIDITTLITSNHQLNKSKQKEMKKKTKKQQRQQHIQQNRNNNRRNVPLHSVHYYRSTLSRSNKSHINCPMNIDINVNCFSNQIRADASGQCFQLKLHNLEIPITHQGKIREYIVWVFCIYICRLHSMKLSNDSMNFVSVLRTSSVF